MILEDQYGVGDVVDLGEADRHRRGGRAARHPAARRQRHRLVRPQRRDPARRQQEPELGAHRARHPGRATARTSTASARAPGGRPRRCGTTTTRGRDHRGARGVGRRGARPRTASSSASSLKTAPLEQWAVARELRERIKAASTTRASRSRSRSGSSGTSPRLPRGHDGVGRSAWESRRPRVRRTARGQKRPASRR